MNNLDAPIQHVIVYTNRARITRAGLMYLDAGEHIITVEGLPLALENKTVRAASPTSGLRIVDVDVQAVSTPSPDSAEIEALQTDYDELLDQDETLADKDRVLSNRLNALRDMYNAASEQLGASLARGDLPLDNINVILDYMSEQEDQINQQRREIARQRRELAEKIREVQRTVPVGGALKTRESMAAPTPQAPPTSTDDEDDDKNGDDAATSLLRRRPSGRDERKDNSERRSPFGPARTGLGSALNRLANKRKRITLTVYAEQSGEYDFQISYNVTQASWKPFYDVRVNDGQFSLTFMAEIQQNTREAWPAVPLTLSTARPLQDADMPKIKPWIIDVERPTPPRRNPFGRRDDNTNNQRSFRRPPNPPQRPAFGRGNNHDDEQENHDEARAKRVKLDEEPAQISGVTPTVTYEVQQNLEISGDNTAHKAFVETFELEGDLELIAIPEQAETAFLCAHIRNVTNHVLLAGSALIFFGTQYIGKTQLKAINPNHKFMVQLGEQERLRVERKLDKHTSTRSASDSAKSRTEFIYRIRVFNDSDDHVQLKIYDHIPIAQHKDIVVHLRAMSPNPTGKHNHNIFDWELEIEPGKHEEITMGFALDHPHDMKIVSKRS